MENTNRLCDNCNTETEFSNIISTATDLVLMRCPNCKAMKTIIDHELVEEQKKKPIIKETKMVPYRQELNCYCGGEFERMNPDIVLTTYPPQYQYMCNKCGNRITDSEVYPKIVYKEETIAHRLF